MADARAERSLRAPQDPPAALIERLRLGAWPVAILGIVFVVYFRHFGSFALPAAGVLLAVAASVWHSPSGASLAAGLVVSAAAAAWAIWRVSQPWSFTAAVAQNPYLPQETIQLLPAAFAVGAALQLVRLLVLWHRVGRVPRRAVT